MGVLVARLMGRTLISIALALATVGCGAPAGTPVGVSGAGSALLWGHGDYGVVLAHEPGRDAQSWGPLAIKLANSGMTVLAPQQTDAAALLAAIKELHEGRGLARVALLAAGESSAAALQVGRDHPEQVDQLILISARGDAASLGVFPKLFIAGAGEGAAADAQRMADESPGDWNAVFLAQGSASGQALLDSQGAEDVQTAILRRLEERR